MTHARAMPKSWTSFTSYGTTTELLMGKRFSLPEPLPFGENGGGADKDRRGGRTSRRRGASGTAPLSAPGGKAPSTSARDRNPAAWRSRTR